MKRLLSLIAIVILAGCFVCSCGPSSPGEQSPEDFYKGNTITLIVPFRAGGGTDTVARVFATYLEAETGANVLVENRDAGGGTEGCNYLYNNAKKDGTALGYHTLVSTWSLELLNNPAVEYEMTKFKYIGSYALDRKTIYVSAKGPYKSVEDLQKAGKQLIFGVPSPSDDLAMGSAIAIDILNLDAKIIPGLRGKTDQILGLQKGEIDACCGAVSGLLSFIEKGEITPLCIVGTEREKWDYPAISELVDLTDEQRNAIRTLELMRDDKGVVAPPGIPENRLEYLKAVFAKIAENPDYQADMANYFGFWPGYMSGEEAAQKADALKQNQSKFQGLADLVQKYL